MNDKMNDENDVKCDDNKQQSTRGSRNSAAAVPCNQQGCLWPMASASWQHAVNAVHGVLLEWQEH